MSNKKDGGAGEREREEVASAWAGGRREREKRTRESGEREGKS